MTENMHFNFFCISFVVVNSECVFSNGNPNHLFPLCFHLPNFISWSWILLEFICMLPVLNTFRYEYASIDRYRPFFASLMVFLVVLYWGFFTQHLQGCPSSKMHIAELHGESSLLFFFPNLGSVSWGSKRKGGKKKDKGNRYFGMRTK